jgi:hypothetical protein
MATSFDRACSLVDAAVSGQIRRAIVAEAAAAKDFSGALRRLAAAMASHLLPAGGRHADFSAVVQEYDRRARQDGFHVLHDWDGKADHVNDDTIPVDVANYLIAQRGGEAPDAAALLILLDYYFLNLMSLLSLRIWDEGQADANLERLNGLLEHLQGPQGSGQRFASHAGTLILLATAHFELEERGYNALLEKVKTLDRAHRAAIALDHAGSVGCHLRFGFEATYGRDTVVMRGDNVADYPWLAFALTTLMEEYGRRPDQALVEGILNGLSPDAMAFVRTPPFGELFAAHRAQLLERFEAFRPGERTYSPLAFFFNFSHNVVKGAVVDALVRGVPWTVTLNDLLTALPPWDGPGTEAKRWLATTLMGYARRHPDRIRGRLMPVIVYDPVAGRQAFAVTMRKLKEIT